MTTVRMRSQAPSALTGIETHVVQYFAMVSSRAVAVLTLYGWFLLPGHFRLSSPLGS